MKIYPRQAFKAFWDALQGRTVQVQTKIVYILDEDVYKKIEKAVRPPILDREASAHDAAYLLGIQTVLRFLRDRF